MSKLHIGLTLLLVFLAYASWHSEHQQHVYPVHHQETVHE